MIKTVKNVMLATALLGTSAIGGEIEVKFSGDAEITYKNEKVGSEQNAYNETEVNLMLDAVNKDGVEFHSKFVVYNGVQGDVDNDLSNDGDGAESNMETKEAYVVAPLGKAKLIAGLKEDIVYGTEAFDTLDPFWRTAIVFPIAKNTTLQLVTKKLAEQGQNDSKGDSDATVLRIDSSIGEFKLGAKTAQLVMNKDEATQKEKSVVGAYVTGSLGGFDIAFEYMKESKDFEGKGFFISAAKEFEDISASIAYVNLSDGLKGGGDFAVGDILDGNIDSSITKDTTAVVVPLSYKLNDSLTTNVTLVKADILEQSATEFDFGIEYALGEQTAISAVYATASGDGMKTLLDGEDKQTNMSVAVTMEF